MFKTVGEACNLACDYCYYSHVAGNPSGVRAIPQTILEPFLADYMDHVAGGEASFVWQGGEPTLAGLPYFQSVVALEARHARPHTRIGNSVQTNGILLNDAWAQFFRQYRFLVGVSLDGPEAIHDARRIDAHHGGSFRRAMRGIDHLRKNGVEYNILTVINKYNVSKARELIQWYRSEGFTWVQFIPCMEFSAQSTGDVRTYEITPDQYGLFLCEAFDVWREDPSFSIRMFDNMIMTLGGSSGDMCILQELCPPFIVVEKDGSAYPCDFLIGPEWVLGNIATTSVFDMIASDRYRAFRRLKPNIASECRTCDWLSLCHGGCPRTRLGGVGMDTVDFFCESYKMLYSRAVPLIKGYSQRPSQGIPLQLYDGQGAPRH